MSILNFYQVKHIETTDPKHSKTDKFPETAVYRGGKFVKLFTGPKAKIEARNYVTMKGGTEESIAA